MGGRRSRRTRRREFAEFLVQVGQSCGHLNHGEGHDCGEAGGISVKAGKLGGVWEQHLDENVRLWTRLDSTGETYDQPAVSIKEFGYLHQAEPFFDQRSIDGLGWLVEQQEQQLLQMYDLEEFLCPRD